MSSVLKAEGHEGQERSAISLVKACGEVTFTCGFKEGAFWLSFSGDHRKLPTGPGETVYA